MTYESISKESTISSLQSSVDEVLSTIEDPTTQEKRQFVYMREPDVASDGFGGYPHVYVEDYFVEMEQATLNGNVFTVPAEVELVVEAADEDAETKKFQDQLSDRVINAFMFAERSNLAQSSWANITLESNNRNTTVRQDGKPILRRTITFSFTATVDFDE